MIGRIFSNSWESFWGEDIHGQYIHLNRMMRTRSDAISKSSQNFRMPNVHQAHLIRAFRFIIMPFYLVLCASVALQRVSSGCITWTDNAVYVVRLKHRNRVGRTCDACTNTHTHMPLDERPCILCVVRARCISCTQRIYDAEIAYSIIIIIVIDEHWQRRRVGWTFIDSIFGLDTR